jgi:hypothetical protein
MFRDLHTYTSETLCARFDAAPLAIPSDYAQRHGVLRGAPVIMTNVAYETARLRKVRLTYLDAGSAAQILTVMAFPRFNTDLPIFGAEVLGFKGAPHLVVLDHQPLYKDDPDYMRRYSDPLADIYHQYAHLPSKGRTLPAWTEAFFSPYTHYSRPTPDDLPAVFAVYRAYWDRYLDQAAASQTLPAARHAAIRARHAAYCQDHIEHEQGESMLNNLFGAAWCAGFIHDFLFDVHPSEMIA